MKNPEHTIVLRRGFAARPEALYAYFTDPGLMGRWMAETVEADVRVGGRYRLHYVAEDGTGYFHTGEYLAIEPGRHIVQSFRAGFSEQDLSAPSPYSNEFVDIALSPAEDGGTVLTLTNGWDGEGLDAEGTRGALEGWSLWLDGLSKALAAPGP